MRKEKRLDVNLPTTQSDIDVSVILNVHREADYLRATLHSLSACAEFALGEGLTTELVVVFDRSDSNTVSVFTNTQIQGFSHVRSIEVDVGSLGLARNAGIAVARGEFIWTADADDLVSRNAIVQLEAIARIDGVDRTAVFLEYCLGFGQKYYVARYERSSLLTAADFAVTHPYVSRIFLKRSIFEKLKYIDLPLSRGFAFEDWELNARLFAAGITFSIAPGTILFYRHRPNSLLQQMNNHSARIIPHSPLFEPDTFLSLMRKKRAETPQWQKFIGIRHEISQSNLVEELLSLPSLRRYLLEAALLDPEVDPPKFESASSYCPIPWRDDHWGFYLEQTFAIVGTAKFSDVLLLPWLNPGGAEKYILSVLDALKEAGGSSRTLVICGQSADRHGWRNRLGAEFVFLDIYNAFPDLDTESRDELIARVILSFARPNARLHLKPSEFCHRVLERFGSALSSEIDVIYYRFSDPLTRWNRSQFRSSWAISFLKRNSEHIRSIISDCQFILTQDIGLLPSIASKCHCVRATCELSSTPESWSTEPTFKLLWASRISPEKRPDLIVAIARALSRRLPNIHIEIYGTSTVHYAAEAIFKSPSVEYKGNFDGFQSLPVSRYDGLVYTSAYDGMPNVILEAMASGLSIIAPDVGGIPEAVHDETGFLVNDCENTDELVAGYLFAIEQMYSDWPSTLAKRRKAYELVSRRHSKDSTRVDVSRALNYSSHAQENIEASCEDTTAPASPAHQHSKLENKELAIMGVTRRGTEHDLEFLRRRLKELESQIVARDERITALGHLVHKCAPGGPSNFKRLLVRTWDSLPRSVQRKIEPFADYLDRVVK